MTDRNERDEAAANERLGIVMGFAGDAPLCPHCKADEHTDPACPVKASQERHAASQKAEREKWERATYGPPKRRKR
jgi:hypothetical protein